MPFRSVLTTPDPPDGAARSTHEPVGHSPMGGPAPTAVGQASNAAALIAPTHTLFRMQIMLSPLVTFAALSGPSIPGCESCYKLVGLEQDVRVGVERHRLADVAELGGNVRHRNAFADLHARIAVAQIVR